MHSGRKLKVLAAPRQYSSGRSLRFGWDATECACFYELASKWSSSTGVSCYVPYLLLRYRVTPNKHAINHSVRSRRRRWLWYYETTVRALSASTGRHISASSSRYFCVRCLRQYVHGAEMFYLLSK